MVKSGTVKTQQRNSKCTPGQVLGLVSALAVALTLSACSDFDVELDAPVLSSVGLNLGGKKKPLQIKERAPLIVPPTANLPKPGAVAQAPTNIDWPDDPDERAKKLAELKRQKEIEEGKVKGPWHKMINQAIANNQQPAEKKNQQQNQQGSENPIPASTPAPSEGSDVDMEARVEEMIR